MDGRCPSHRSSVTTDIVKVTQDIAAPFDCQWSITPWIMFPSVGSCKESVFRISNLSPLRSTRREDIGSRFSVPTGLAENLAYNLFLVIKETVCKCRRAWFLQGCAVRSVNAQMLGCWNDHRSGPAVLHRKRFQALCLIP